jgi:ParB-like chromosome segregation protein Spo0J
MSSDIISPAKKTDDQNPNPNPNHLSAPLTICTKGDYLNLIPPLSTNEYELLKESIRQNGLLVPIIVNPEGIVLDGAHRYKACIELRIPIKYETKQLEDSSDEKLFQIEINLRRRQLNAYQKIEVGYRLEGVLKESAKTRMSLGGTIVGLGNGKQFSYGDNERVASIKATLQSMEKRARFQR